GILDRAGVRTAGRDLPRRDISRNPAAVTYSYEPGPASRRAVPARLRRAAQTRRREARPGTTRAYARRDCPRPRGVFASRPIGTIRGEKSVFSRRGGGNAAHPRRSRPEETRGQAGRWRAAVRTVRIGSRGRARSGYAARGR